MAQFGKHIFGTSLFGESNAFTGVYDTKIIDTGKSFNGSITVNLKNELPSSSYSHNEIISLGKTEEYVDDEKKEYPMFFYEGTTVQTKEHTTLSAGATASVYLSGKDIKVIHGAGKATVTVKEEQTEEVRTFTTNNTGVLALDNFPEDTLANYSITITAIEDFEFIQLDVLTTEIQALVRATTEEMGRTDYFLKGDWPLSYKTEATKEHDKYWIYSHKLNLKKTNDTLTGTTDYFENVRYAQIKLILLTTDKETSPIVNEIEFYSGDISKYRESGRWQASLDMNNIASDKNVEFKRTLKVDWIEEENEQSRFDLHSSSTTGNTPSIFNIINDGYWSDLSAKYTLIHNGLEQGTPYGRVALKEQGNRYNESTTYGSLITGPINTLNFGFTNTVIDDWVKFSGNYFYPRNSNKSKIEVYLYKTENDAIKNYNPTYVIKDIESYKDVLLESPEVYDNLYAKIILKRTEDVSTPVFDVFNLHTNLQYRKTYSNVKKLSALDGHEQNNPIGLGKKEIDKVSKNFFEWPSLNQKLTINEENIRNSTKNLELEYTPKYLNQVYLGIENTEDTSFSFVENYPDEYILYSQTYAKDPIASVNEVDKEKLYWHYSYDGGTVNFPIETEKQLTTQFTPLLLTEKQYKYKIINGWDGETFKVPYTMTLKEVSEITSQSLDEIKEENKNIPLYDNKVLTGYEINLPNKSFNEKINLKFKKNNDIVTDYSILNETENDVIRAWINKSDNYQYTNWTSDEKFFNGIINLNDKKSIYSREQNSSHNISQKGNHTVSIEKETATEIAAKYNVNIEDLLLLNNKKEVFKRNEIVVIPSTYSLPDIEPGLIYEGEHPYVIEVIPGTVRRTKDNNRLPDNILKPGSEDEKAIDYTLTESSTETIYIERGNILNGRDRLPVSNVTKIHSIVDQTGKNTYIKATETMGDYILTKNHIDWSPAFKNSKEPKAGDLYAVTLTRGVVDNLRITYSSDYSEKMSLDRMAAIPIIENKNYKMDLSVDQIIELEKIEKVKKQYPSLKNIRYISENSDLWVNTKIIDNEVHVSLNKEDPNINWYPTINTGFYYLNNKEHYLYSRLTETVFSDKDIPVIKNVEYTKKGMTVSK